VPNGWMRILLPPLICEIGSVALLPRTKKLYDGRHLEFSTPKRRSKDHMKVALHKNVTLSESDAFNVLDSCARQADFAELNIVMFNSSIDLADELEPSKKDVLDLIIAPFQLSDTNFVSALEEVRVEFPEVYSIVFDKGIEHAAAASEASVDCYLAEPVSAAAFEKALARVFDSLKRLHAASFVANTIAGYRRIPFHSLLYCETSGHDQILHFEDGRSLGAHYSSQGLFDLLSEDGRFFKVGSSYIVNLNEVEEVNAPGGTLTLSNGARLPIPFRIRKPLERALLEW